MGTIEAGRQIATLAKKLTNAEQGIWISPNIEVETQNIAPDLDRRELLFVTNAAAFPADGKIRSGMAFSVDAVYYSNTSGNSRSFPLNQVETINYDGKNRFGTYSPGDKITITLFNGEQHVLGECLLGCDVQAVTKLLAEAAQTNVSINSIEETQRLSLSDLSHYQQVSYMEILYNYAQITDGEVDPTEYAALQSIGVRIGLAADVRNELRDYLFIMRESGRVKTGVLIKRCAEHMSYGSYEIFRFSLMQDILYLRAVNDAKTPWYEDAFVNSLQQMLQISDEQIEDMLAAIAIYRKMQQKDADLESLKKDMELLWRHTKTLDIPREAIFCSGSVYSIDTYRGVMKKRKQKQSITRQRELMLQEVIRNTQISLNHLVEDLNDTTLRLVEEVSRGNQRDQAIEKLSGFIKKYQAQMSAMAKKSDEVSVAQLYNRMPKLLDAGRVEQLLPMDRQQVQTCYILKNQGTYMIRENLSYEELEKLARIEEIIEDE